MMAATKSVRKSSLGAVIALALVAGACGGDDDSLADDPVVSDTLAEDGSDPAADDAGTTELGSDAEDADDAELVEAQASGSVGSTNYSFEPTASTFCRISESIGAASISGLVDEDTGAELSIDYSADNPGSAMVSIRVPDGANWEASGVVTFAPVMSFDGSMLIASGRFGDLNAAADAPPAIGSIVASCS